MLRVVVGILLLLLLRVVVGILLLLLLLVLLVVLGGLVVVVLLVLLVAVAAVCGSVAVVRRVQIVQHVHLGTGSAPASSQQLPTTATGLENTWTWSGGQGVAAAVARELGGAAWRAHGDRQRGLSGEAGDIYPRDCVFATGEYLELCKKQQRRRHRCSILCNMQIYNH